MDGIFALYESGAGYELVNDHIVTAGEHTIPAATVAKTVGHGGKDLFDIDELNRPALERAITARAAIEIMGEHVEKYGYYGTEWDKRSNYAESGEALSIPDLVEAWMFHIVPDDTGARAVWVGKRVPDGHISAVAIRPLSATSNSTMPAISCIRLRACCCKTALGVNPHARVRSAQFCYSVRQYPVPPSSYVTLRLL